MTDRQKLMRAEAALRCAKAAIDGYFKTMEYLDIDEKELKLQP